VPARPYEHVYTRADDGHPELIASHRSGPGRECRERLQFTQCDKPRLLQIDGNGQLIWGQAAGRSTLLLSKHALENGVGLR